MQLSEEIPKPVIKFQETAITEFKCSFFAYGPNPEGKFRAWLGR